MVVSPCGTEPTSPTFCYNIDPPEVLMTSRRVALLVALCLSVVACNRGAEPELTVPPTQPAPTSDAAPTTVAPAADPTTTTASEAGAETTVPPAIDITDFEVAVATAVDEGEVRWLVIPPEDYTDRDLEQFVLGQVDESENLWELYVVDDAEAVDALRVEPGSRTEEEAALVDQHFLISLTDGNVVEFHGPFADVPGFVVGS